MPGVRMPDAATVRESFPVVLHGPQFEDPATEMWINSETRNASGCGSLARLTPAHELP